jgi:hypothetical protein
MSTFAGGVQPASVEIEFDDDGNFFVGGDMWTARSSNNDTEMIGCSVKRYAAQGNDWGFCQAVNADDNFIICFTQNEKMMEAIYAISDASYISFFGKGYEEYDGFPGEGEGECTRISISSQSMYLPLVTTERAGKK